MLLKIIKRLFMQVPTQPKNDEPKSTQKRDRLKEIETQAQKLWEAERFHEKEVDPTKPKFLVTFPYPYMNGRLHLGHAFSMSKPEFYGRYKSLKGYNVLFPFGFHCTGMPISAASLKLKEELTQKYSKEQLLEILESRKEPHREESFKKQPMTQYEIMLGNHVKEEEFPNFYNSEHWLRYFPPKGETDLKSFGAMVDFRRSFITTSTNPYYDSFIQWQFRKLEKNGFLKFGKRPSIYSEKDKQMCADHDRAEGEGVLPQEYTLIKIRVLNTKSDLLNKFLAEKKIVVMPAATLRPETMYGQTNCFVLPTGEYGVYEMKNNEIWVCSEHSMRNLSWQGKTSELGQIHKLGMVIGQDMIGSEVSAPLATFKSVYVWPMLSISMFKGTGIVTSVPSDAPDDYAVMHELKKKKAFREKFGLTDEQVLPFDPVPIIETKKYQTLAAVKAFEAFKIQSMNDHEKLKLAKEDVYQDGFYSGVMTVGEFAGKKVFDAKPLIKAKMIEANDADTYYEPDGKCVSRSGDVCVVAYCDQWYITYGVEEIKEKLKSYVKSSEFNSFNETIKNGFVAALDWLKDWGCSRSFGLGTRLPCDKQYLIESLSDSTIYMSYYTISNILHTDLYGEKPGKYGVMASDITEGDWDHIFLNKSMPKDTKLPAEMISEMKTSFNYWYPLDLRCSGKDLVKNHLTMSLYNHAFVWGQENINMLPKGIFCNGWVLVDGEKMSKSKGNFLLLGDVCQNLSADVLRLSLANAGDTIEDANIEIKTIDNILLKLATLESWMQDMKKLASTFREDSPADLVFFDKIFESKIKQVAMLVDVSYDKMLFRDVMKEAFFNMSHLRDEYKYHCGPQGPRRDLIRLFIETQLLIMYPIVPHFAEIMWMDVLQSFLDEKQMASCPKHISNAKYPSYDTAKVDMLVLKEFEYLQKLGKSLRSSCEKISKKKANAKFEKVTFIVSLKFHDWQLKVLKYLQTVKFDNTTKAPLSDWKKEIKDLITDPKVSKKAFEFASFRIKEYAILGAESFNDVVLFHETVLIKKHIDIILKDSFEIGEIVVMDVEDAAKSTDKNLNQNVESCFPSNPIIALEVK